VPDDQFATIHIGDCREIRKTAWGKYVPGSVCERLIPRDG
jgi:hypothetical protein